MRDRYKVEEIERAADVIVWCCDEAPGFAPTPPAGPQLRRQHRAGDGGIRRRALGEQPVPLEDAEHMIVIGSDRMMQAVGAARHGVLAPYLQPGPHARSARSTRPMQCMMKEVCAQCLQPHVDPARPASGRVVFSCFNQDQALDRVDFPALHERLAQNGLQEKLTAQWIDRALRCLDARPAIAAE